jgi:hypothetical protein
MSIYDNIWRVRKNMEKIVIASAIIATTAAICPLPLQCL